MRVDVCSGFHIPRLVELLHEAHSVAPMYAGLPFHLGLARKYVEGFVIGANALAVGAFDEDTLVGFLFGRLGLHPFGEALLAHEDGFYVQPEARSLALASEMLERYIQWARDREALRAHVGTSSGYKPSACLKLFEHVGFKSYGHLAYVETRG